jgi:hypothetical protein
MVLSWKKRRDNFTFYLYPPICKKFHEDPLSSSGNET